MPRTYVPARIRKEDRDHLGLLKITNKRSNQSMIDEALAEYRANHPVNMRQTFNTTVSGVVTTKTNDKRKKV